MNEDDVIIVQTQAPPVIIRVAEQGPQGIQGPTGATGAQGPQGDPGPSVWGVITGTLSDQTDLQTALDGKVDENAAITGATKTKITYDAKGLVTSGADAAVADITGLQDALDLKANLALANFTNLQLATRQVAGYEYGSNANGNWHKWFDKDGNIIAQVQTWSATAISGGTITANLPTAFPDDNYKVPCAGNNAGSGVVIGYVNQSNNTVSTFTVWMRRLDSGVLTNSTVSGIAYWIKS